MLFMVEVVKVKDVLEDIYIKGLIDTIFEKVEFDPMPTSFPATP